MTQTVRKEWHESWFSLLIQKLSVNLCIGRVQLHWEQSKFKAMMIVFCPYILYLNWGPVDQTVNQHYYCEVLALLNKNIRKSHRYFIRTTHQHIFHYLFMCNICVRPSALFAWPATMWLLSVATPRILNILLRYSISLL